MSQANVPLAVGSANLGPQPRSAMGDTTLEQNTREYFRKLSGRWNRLFVNLAPGETVLGQKLNSGNLRVSNVIMFAYPIVLGGTVNLSVWESTSGGQMLTDTTYFIRDTNKLQFPGIDDRTYWQVTNNGADAVRFAIYYQEAGTY